MSDLTDLLQPQAILTGQHAANKKVLFQQLGSLAARLVGADARVVADRLAARERLGSTGFGAGVAIPHARLDGLSGIAGIFVRLAQPVDFAAVDDLPVDLVFALLSPTGAGADHLKSLARVSRRLRNGDFLAKLRGAGSPDALYALFGADEARNAA